MDDGDLPNGWALVKFGDVVRHVNESTKDPHSVGISRVVGLDHLDRESLAIRRWDELSDLPDGTSFTRVFRTGQVLFGKRRAYQRKTAVADFDGICSSDILVFEASSDELLREYLPYLVQSEGFFHHALGTSAGSLSPRTKWQELAKYEFALPPTDQQKLIVEVLDTVGALVDSYAAVVDRLAVQSEAFAHSIAEDARESGALTKVVDLVEPDRPVTYGIQKPGTGCPGGVPVVKVKDFPDGRISESALLLTSHEIDDEYRRSRLRAGDLLISIRGTVGRLAEVPPSLEGANITQDTARLSIRADHDRRYIRHILGTRDVQAQIRQRITGLAVKGINIGALRQVEVPTPSLEHQRRLAAEFETLELAAERAREALQAAHQLRSSLRESLMSGGVHVQ
jgi:type I restriction enzyme S subunit